MKGKSIFLSLFWHFVIIFFLLTAFNFKPPLKIEEEKKVVAISFLKAPEKLPEITPPPLPKKVPEQIIPKEVPIPKQMPKKIPEKKKIVKKPAKKKIIKPKKKKEIKTKPRKKLIKKAEPKKEPEKKIIKKTEPKPPKETPESKYSFTQNEIAKMNLLPRQKFNLKNQLKICYQRSLRQEKIEKIDNIKAHIFLKKDGIIEIRKTVFQDFTAKKDDKNFLTAVKIVKNALKFCNPLGSLPANKYNIWKEIDLEFGD
jgi:hypothetical protein